MARIPAPRERDIQRLCRDWLTAFGAFVIRVNSGAVSATANGRSRFVRFNDQPGCSDLLAVLPGGHFLAVEVKRPGGKPTPKQRAFLDAVTAAGGLALVVDSLDALREALARENYDVGL